MRRQENAMIPPSKLIHKPPLVIQLRTTGITQVRHRSPKLYGTLNIVFRSSRLCWTRQDGAGDCYEQPRPHPPLKHRVRSVNIQSGLSRVISTSNRNFLYRVAMLYGKSHARIWALSKYMYEQSNHSIFHMDIIPCVSVCFTEISGSNSPPALVSPPVDDVSPIFCSDA